MYTQQQTSSQYRGTQQTFQPTGYVQSVYGQNKGFQTSGMTSGFGTTSQQNQQSFHTANYRGNQPGHDSQWRGDAKNPSQSQFGVTSGYTSVQTQTWPSQYQTSFAGSQFGKVSNFTPVNTFAAQAQAQQMQQQQSQVSFHAANYRGNQPGHDNQLRSDASSPWQSKYNTNTFGFNK